ncbi:MAG: sigma-70 family RNA polymerase sigma factor [Bacilli bacterium]|nr:sigma-70 family RNA polymerase sigma factor [Bacilli bacterium]
MAKNKVELTGVNTSGLKTLKNSEMNQLFNDYHNGIKSAKEKLIKGNLRLVLSILQKYQNRCDNMDDLFQIGTIGLIKAVDNFDLSFGVKFSTYAVFMIEGEIKRYIRDNNQIRISRTIKELSYKIINFKEEYIKKYYEYPSNELICEKFNISPYELNIAISSLTEPVSIFEPIYNDGGDTILLLDQLEDKSNTNISDYLALKEALLKIKERERLIITKRYLIGLSQAEIASELNISQAQVSRIENSALNSIKKLIL